MSNSPFIDHRKPLDLPETVDINRCYKDWIIDYKKLFIFPFVKAVFNAIDNYYRFAEYVFDRPVAVCISDVFGKYLELQFKWIGLINVIALETIEKDQEFNIVCWQEDSLELSKKYQKASIFTISKREVIRSLMNQNWWLVTKDQDTANLTEFLNYAIRAELYQPQKWNGILLWARNIVKRLIARSGAIIRSSSPKRI